MTIDSTVNDLLNAGDGPYFKFDTIGTTHRGIVVSAHTEPETDLDRKPKTWDDGRPKMQIVVRLQTGQRDDDNDDGIRRLFVKGYMVDALRTALGPNKLEAGGELAVQYNADKPSSTPGYRPSKQYIAQYRAPAPTAAANDLLGATTTPSSASWATDGGTPTPATQAVDPWAGSDFMDK